jgi:hypothetical protein
MREWKRTELKLTAEKEAKEKAEKKAKKQSKVARKLERYHEKLVAGQSGEKAASSRHMDAL